MADQSIFRDIAERTGGDIYIGVVGPVRTGKSTLIKKITETLVIPHIEDAYRRDRALDELPQSAAGRTVMTTEPKFIPEEAAELMLEDGMKVRVRLIDCVGYIVPGARGYLEEEQPRMVMTPWFDEPVPFNMAAEVGTQKVIAEHSTIGLVVTTDGSVCEIDREDYTEAEARVIGELKELGKPFAVLLNSAHPEAEETQALAHRLTDTYGVAVLPVDCLRLNEEDVRNVLSTVLGEFPVREIRLELPGWLTALAPEHPLKASLYADIREAANDVRCVREARRVPDLLAQNEFVSSAAVSRTEPGEGSVTVRVRLPQRLFYRVLSESTGVEISDDGQLMRLVTELNHAKENYDRVADAMREADASGYGIVTPAMEDLSLEEPEIVRQGSRFGVRLKASAPSYHIIKANIETEVSPVVGSEKQSEELVRFLLTGFEEDPKKIWESNLFGKSLHELVNEGLHTKLNKLPSDAREKVQGTLEKIINEGSGGLICIIL